MSGIRCRINKISLTNYVAVAFLIVLAGCAGSVDQISNESLLPEIDVIQIKQTSDDALRLARETRLETEVMATKITELDNKFILIKEDVTDISPARFEEIETKLSLLIEAIKELQVQVKAAHALSNSAIEMATSVKQNPSKPLPATPKSTVPTFSPVLEISAEYEQYQKSLKLFNGRHYNESIAAFKALLADYPDGKYSDNAHYWIGECHYGLMDYAAAVGAFKQIFAFNNSSKTDDAHYKLAMCYLRLGQASAAANELNTLLNRYPGSEYVDRAQKYLADLK